MQNDNAKSKMENPKYEARNKLIIREAGYGRQYIGVST